MNDVRKIAVVITARPSYSRVKTVLKAIKGHSLLKLQLIVAASALLDRYGNVSKNILADGFDIDEKVFMVLEGENPTTMAKTTGLGVMELATVFSNLKPDIVVTIADRYETIATAIAGAYMNIPVAHIQGGEVTGSIDEKVRHSITKLSDYHFTSSKDASNRVIKLGEDPNFVFNTGCPSIDLAKKVKNSNSLDFIPTDKYKGVGADLSDVKDYIVVMQHPVTTEYIRSKEHVTYTLQAIHDLNQPTFWFWPNVDAGSDATSGAIRRFRERNVNNKIHFFKHMDSIDFLKLLCNSECLVGNSSVGIRECAYLGIPVVNIGTRQQKRQRGNNVIDVGYNSESIRNAVLKWKNLPNPITSDVYGDGKAGKKIADILSKLPLKTQKIITF